MFKRNVLLSDDESTIFFADLAECYVLKGTDLTASRGAKVYMAPERLKARESASFKSDLW